MSIVYEVTFTHRIKANVTASEKEIDVSESLILDATKSQFFNS